MNSSPPAVPAAGRPECELCREAGGLPVWHDDEWRVIRVADEAFPAFYRVVSQVHVAEFTDLARPARERGLLLVAAVEQVLRASLQPTKINLASLGNLTPHLHWHVIARFDWDSHFPQPVWGTRQREPVPAPAGRLALGLDTLDARVAAALQAAA